ncbi:metallophosphoesterase family protein [Candidatus Magnetobacterium casense]|uniref:Metallophosphoesterase n=1 Tax=Candidatus Magnetobacterium casense TaxID=1455061 RepID=A0ABS6RU54_9BACT|nr:metallophosphoesterase [Candidatus Magnetobacterium casensis]MBV6340121.1 metallophosphoesterase [Candidatus Magnetobacterium casensis]
MIGVIGDLHFKESLGYADYIEDRRRGEKQGILDFIVKELSDCDTIVMMGDQLNARNNLSSVIKDFVAFLECFNGKKVYVLAGNHEKKGDGSSAIDFLKEINNPNWEVITDGPPFFAKMGNARVALLPYMPRTELDSTTNEEALAKITKALRRIKDGDILFTHYSVSDIVTDNGIQTNLFNDIILPKKQMEKMFKLVVAGHIHTPGIHGNTIITGSIFNDEIGEVGKKIWKIDPKDLKYRGIDLPGRPIMKAENIMSVDDMMNGPSFPKHAIVKVTLTDPKLKDKVEDIKKYLREHTDAYILLEQYPRERKKAHFDEGMLQFQVEDLLGVYAKAKKVDPKKLLSAWELIKD